jgi:hypothetical protein
VPVDEIEAAMEELDPRVFRQEYLASFLTLAGQVYDNSAGRYGQLGNLDDSDHRRPSVNCTWAWISTSTP